MGDTKSVTPLSKTWHTFKAWREAKQEGAIQTGHRSIHFAKQDMQMDSYNQYFMQCEKPHLLKAE